jgi:F-type H+-transporting ATPase subunit epsilon
MAEGHPTLELEVATLQGIELKAQATRVAAQSVRGEFGVLPGHLPFLAALKPGVLRYRDHEGEHSAAVGRGFVEAGDNKVTILAQQFASADGVQASQVREELAKAEQELKSFKGTQDDPEFVRIQDEVLWAQAKLALLG